MGFINIIIGFALICISAIWTVYAFGMIIPAITYLLSSHKLKNMFNIKPKLRYFLLDLWYFVLPTTMLVILFVFIENRFISVGACIGLLFTIFSRTTEIVAKTCANLFLRRYYNCLPKDKNGELNIEVQVKVYEYMYRKGYKIHAIVAIPFLILCIYLTSKLLVG